MACRTGLKQAMPRGGPSRVCHSMVSTHTRSFASATTNFLPSTSTSTASTAGPSRRHAQQWRGPAHPQSIQSKRAFTSLHPRISPLTHRPLLPRRQAAATMAKPEESLPPPAHSLEIPLDVTPPSLEAIKEEGYLDDDVQLVPEDEAYIVITPDAVQQLVKITSKEPAEVLEKGQLALRVGVESGGCHGYQYTMEIVEQRGTDDYVMQPIGYDCIPVVVDLVSLGLLKGATLHHATELIGSSFRIQENPQAKEGGNCGCGVSWELK